MKRSIVLLLVLAVGLALAAVPASADPPAESGVVERGEVPFWVWDFDEKSGLVALFNLDVEAFCDEANRPDPNWMEPPLGIIQGVPSKANYVPPLEETSDPFTGDPLPFPSFLEQLKDEALPTEVRTINESFFEMLEAVFAAETDLEFWEAFCEWFPVNEPIATGTSRFRSTDNDVIAPISDNNRSNAFGYSANGKLVGDECGKCMFHATARFQWKGDIFAPEDFKANVKIRLH